MTENVFRREIDKAHRLGINENAAYWAGYAYGIRCQYHGDSFGTPEEREAYAGRKDDTGNGYRDGLAFRDRRGGNHGGGRKPGDKDEQLNFRISHLQRQTLHRNAVKNGMTDSDWIISRCC